MTMMLVYKMVIANDNAMCHECGLEFLLTFISVTIGPEE